MTQDWEKKLALILLEMAVKVKSKDSVGAVDKAFEEIKTLLSKDRQRVNQEWKEKVEQIEGLVRLGGIRHADGIMKGWWVNYQEVMDVLDKKSEENE
jgi:hypothetical protein